MIDDWNIRCQAISEYTSPTFACHQVLIDSNNQYQNHVWATAPRPECNNTWIELEVRGIYTLNSFVYHQRHEAQDQGASMDVEFKDISGNVLRTQRISFRHVNELFAPAETFPIYPAVNDVHFVRFTYREAGAFSNCNPSYLGAQRIRLFGSPQGSEGVEAAMTFPAIPDEFWSANEDATDAAGAETSQGVASRLMGRMLGARS